MLRIRPEAVGRRLSAALVIEPVDPFEGRELDVGHRLPGAVAVDLLGLEQADRRLGQGVVVAVADAADRRVDAGLDEPGGATMP